MATKIKIDLRKKDLRRVKYVRAAKQWCLTTIKDGKQSTTFYMTKKEAEAA